LLLQRIRAAEKLRNRRMRNRLYGGVRGQVNTKGGEHLRLVFTSYSIVMIIALNKKRLSLAENRRLDSLSYF
ncbi:MAG: hypothetical protein IJQ83_09035, partial [Bacteroidales bacterium]|nr:hypothetical protein [Bacteroidales bacterium]